MTMAVGYIMLFQVQDDGNHIGSDRSRHVPPAVNVSSHSLHAVVLILRFVPLTVLAVKLLSGNGGFTPPWSVTDCMFCAVLQSMNLPVSA